MTGNVMMGVIVVGAFCLVFVVTPILLICADGLCEAVEKWWARHERRIKRELISRWLTELDMTAVAVPEPCEALREVRTVSVDELMRIINEI